MLHPSRLPVRHGVRRSKRLAGKQPDERLPPTSDPPAPRPAKRPKAAPRRSKPKGTKAVYDRPLFSCDVLAGHSDHVVERILQRTYVSRERNGEHKEYLVQWALGTNTYAAIRDHLAPRDVPRCSGAQPALLGAAFKTEEFDPLDKFTEIEWPDQDWLPCKVCGRDDRQDQQVACYRCFQWFHKGCLPKGKAAGADADDGGWTCPGCAPPSWEDPVDHQVCKIKWPPSWESAANIRNLPGGPEALQRFHTQQLAASGPPDASPAGTRHKRHRPPTPTIAADDREALAAYKRARKAASAAARAQRRGLGPAAPRHVPGR